MIVPFQAILRVNSYNLRYISADWIILSWLNGYITDHLIFIPWDLCKVRYYCAFDPPEIFFVSSSWGPSLRKPRDIWKETVYLEGGPLTRDIAGVIPIAKLRFSKSFFCSSCPTFLHDYWVKSKFGYDSCIKNRTVGRVISLRSNAQYTRKNSYFCWPVYTDKCA